MPALKGIRALLGSEPRWLKVMPPLVALDDPARARLKEDIDALGETQPVTA